MSREPLLGGADEVFGQHSARLLDDEKCVVDLQPVVPSRRRRLLEGSVWLGLPLLLGLVFGLVLPTSESLPEPVQRISSIIGWTYFSAWSVSFYPQIISNYRRKSVEGLSLDFQLLNLLGFSCYAAYNCALFFNDAVRREYACLHDGALPAVHANDVVFALHAVVITALTLAQCAVYPRGGQRVSWVAGLAVGFVLSTTAAYFASVLDASMRGRGGAAGNAASAAMQRHMPACGTLLDWLSFFYFLSYVKLGVSLVKYIPQVYLNYSRQSTEGWNVHNVLLDCGGGLLSLVQLLLDGAVTRDWTAVTGNPVKFALGFSSMFFDIIFFLQHWFWYPAARYGGAAGGKCAALPLPPAEGAAAPAAAAVGVGAAAAEAGGDGGSGAPAEGAGAAADEIAGEQQALLPQKSPGSPLLPV